MTASSTGRAGTPELESRRVAAAILAAGRATRFGAGASSKAVAELDGRPLVRHVAAAAVASRAAPVLIVTGHAAQAVEEALAGLPLAVIHNPDFASGMASSLKAAVAALPPGIDGLLVLLADMPLVRLATLDALIAAFVTDAPDAVVPRFEGRPGNPVLLGRGLFPAVAELDGDLGARKLLARADRRVLLCDVDDAGILADIDTQDALRHVGDLGPSAIGSRSIGRGLDRG